MGITGLGGSPGPNPCDGGTGAAGVYGEVDDLAEALGFDLDRTAAAVERAATHRHLGGPMALHRRPGDRYTLGARLDVLTDRQRTAVLEHATYLEPWDPDQAAFLLAVVAYRPQLGTGADGPLDGWSQEHGDLRGIDNTSRARA